MASTNLVATGDFQINPDQSLKAAKALIKHMKKAAVEKASKVEKLNPLDDEDGAGSFSLSDTPVLLTLITKTFMSDTNRLKPGKIPVPHPLATPTSESSICLIVADPQRAYKDMVASESFPASLRDRIGRVIGFEKLQKKFRIFDAQRQLYASHDIFLADDRIVNRLPKVLGRTFYKNNVKRPIPVVISPAQGNSKKAAPKGTGLRKQARTDNVPAPRVGKPETVAKEIAKAMGAALVNISASPNTVVKVGFADWDPVDIAENITVVARALVKKWVPKQGANVMSISIKGQETTSLPIWMADELWVGEESVVAGAPAEDESERKLLEDTKEGLKEKANTKKKRKPLDNAPVEEPKKKKAKADEGDKAAVDKLVASRRSKLSKEKAAARKSMD